MQELENYLRKPARSRLSVNGEGNVVKVKGPLGELTQKVDPDIKVSVDAGVLTVKRPTDQPATVRCTVSTAHSSTIW